MNIEKTNNRIGQLFYNHDGYAAKCVQYDNSHNIVVEFVDYPIKVKTNWNSFRTGKFGFPINKYGGINDIGCLNDENLISKEYDTWFSMFKRCYSNSIRKIRPTYNNKTVCDEWKLYSNFFDWIRCQENYKKWLDGDNWGLDKDILQKGNSEYSPDKCVLVPNNVNCLFISCQSHRGAYPIGVHYDKVAGKYKAQCRDQFGNKYVNLGRYDTSDDAFRAYKTYKEDQIQKVAQMEYKLKNITQKCYEAMLNYRVEITD